MEATKTLDELANEERKAYFKIWREKNRDKVRQHNRNYWLKRAEAKLQDEKK